MRKLRALLTAYREAGGERPIVLLHDDPHGAPLIDALARFGDGLPANVLPFAVNEVTQIGLESIAAAFAYGASVMRFLLGSGRATMFPDCCGRWRWPIRSSLGSASAPAGLRPSKPTIRTVLLETLRAIPPMPPAPRPASFRPLGEKRGVLRFALRRTASRLAGDPVGVIALPEGAPLGAVEVDVGGCTLCLSCVSVLPDRRIARRSRATDAALCRRCSAYSVDCAKATCPEDVITLGPRSTSTPLRPLPAF